MKKSIKFFKRHLNKVPCLVLCIALVCYILPSVVYAVVSPTNLIGFVTDEDYQDFIDNYMLFASGMTEEEWITTYFEDYYGYVSSDYWGLATGAGGMYGADENFSDSYLESVEQQLAMWFAGNGIPFDWADFVVYAKARRSAELASQQFDSNSYVSSQNFNSIHISGEALKQVAADYNSRYAPMPTVSQYIYSVRNNDLDVKTYNKNYFYYTPYTPVYTYTNGQWGNKGWNSVYILPFVYDDNEGKGYYYHKFFYHFYSSRDDNDVVWFHYDRFNLSDGSLVNSSKIEWDVSNYPVLGFKHFSDTWTVWSYTSHFNYISAASGNLCSSLCTFSDKTFYSSASISVDITISTLLGLSGTLDLDTNLADDMGAIVSETPFELFANQTSIDFSKIPDTYNITIQGDNIYNYPITDPDSGKSTTINNYITNNYIIPDDPDSPDNPDNPNPGGGGSVSGDITVGGNVSVGGQIDINTKPIDININVNDSGSGSSVPDPPVPTLEGLPEGQENIGELIDYYQESGDKIGGLFSGFFAVVPEPIRNMIPLAVGVIIFLGLVKALH